MSTRSYLGLALLLVPFAPAAARAGGEDMPPTIAIQVRSLDTVIDNVKLLVALAGREEIAKQMEGLIKSKIGAKGLEGIDPSRPFGAYSRAGKDLADFSYVVLVPIADEQAFLGLLENLNQKVVKTNDLYRIKVLDRVEVFFRFAHKYAYVTALNPASVEPKKLLAPGKIFLPQHKSAINVVLRVDQIPEAIRFIARAQIEQGLQEAQEKVIPGETPVQKKFRVQMLKEIVENAAAVLSDGRELTVDVDINKATKEMSATLTLSGQANSKLAKSISDLGKTRTLFANLMSKDPVAQGSATFKLPSGLRKLVTAQFEDIQQQALAQISNPVQRKQAEELLKAIDATVQAGEIDAGFSMQGPKNKLYTVAAGMKIRNGNDIEKTLRRLIEQTMKDLPPAERAKIELDAETVAGTKIHRFNFGKNFSPDVKREIGEGPLYLALRDDAVFLAVGPEALALLKTGLGPISTKSPPVALSAQLSLARIAPRLPQAAGNEKLQGMFAPGEEGTIALSVVGGSELTIRLTSRLSVVQLLGAISEKIK